MRGKLYIIETYIKKSIKTAWQMLINFFTLFNFQMMLEQKLPSDLQSQTSQK